MLRVICTKADIRAIQKKLNDSFISKSDKNGKVSIGGLGWNQKARLVYWNKRLDLWWTTREEKDRFWNSFGIGEPKWATGYPHSIVVEINLPKETTARLSGAVAIDNENNLYLMHSGRIGGGRKGIGKSLFTSNFSGEWEEVWDGKENKTLALVSSIGSPRFLTQLSVFVHEVSRIKTEGVQCAKPEEIIPEVFQDEFLGDKEYELSSDVRAKCDHALVISGLRKELQSRGARVGNRQHMDLYVLNEDNKISTLYEAKTDDSSSSCCQAIGQLFFYSRRLNLKPRVVAVFPSTICAEFRSVFHKLGVHVTTYEWKGEEPCFNSLVF